MHNVMSAMCPKQTLTVQANSPSAWYLKDRNTPKGTRLEIWLKAQGILAPVIADVVANREAIDSRFTEHQL